MAAVLEQVEYVSVERAIPMRRVWAMPSASTFDIPPIRALVKSYLHKSKVSVDPFARSKRWATFTNDLNPNTAAEYHMDAEQFLNVLKGRGVIVDCALFDPPYSPRQISECYQSVGKVVTMQDTQNAALYARVRAALNPMVGPGGYVLSFGWNSHGMGNSGRADWVIEEILLICHGGAHNDTICTVERKVESGQAGLFSDNKLSLETTTVASEVLART